MTPKLYAFGMIIVFFALSCSRNSKADKYEEKMSSILDSIHKKRDVERKRRFETTKNKLIDNIYSQRARMDSIFITDQTDLYSDGFDELSKSISAINRKQSNDSIFIYARSNFFDHVFHSSFKSLDTTFYKEISFINSIFKDSVDIQSTFNENLNLGISKFHEYSKFRIKALKSAYFYNTEFKKGVDFSYSEINEFADFSSSKLVDANFEETIFKEDVFFDNITLDGRINFANCQFLENADFRQLTLKNSASLNFENCILPDTLDFSGNSRLQIDIDLSTAAFTDSLHYNKFNGNYFRPHYINLYKADVSKFILDYTHFRLLIKDSIKNISHRFNFDKTPSFIKIPKDETASLYEALLNNFKSRGQAESYKLLDIEYQKYKWKDSRFSCLAIFPDYWWNFGYDRERIFLWVVIFLALFTLITFMKFEYLTSVYQVNGVQIVPLKKILKRFWFSFVYTSTIFFLLTLKVDTIDYRKFWGTIFVIIMYTAGIVCLAYMANYILQK